MSELCNLDFVKFLHGAKFRQCFHGTVFLNWQFYLKKQCSKLCFTHVRCQHLGEENCTFSLISSFGEEFERKFYKTLKLLPFLKLELKTFLSLKNATVSYIMKCSDVLSCLQHKILVLLQFFSNL